MLLRSLAIGLTVLVVAPAHADPIDEIVERYRTVSHIPGVAVAVVERGKVEKLQAYGLANLEWSGPVTIDTPFQTASASKIFTGVLIMRLVEQGTISLDDPLTRFFPDAPETWRAITVRHMASHMSGLPEQLGLSSSATPQEFVKAAMGRPLAYEPGSQSRYGFTDFIVFTAALEKATGLSYPDLLKREIATPLGLTGTGFDFATDGAPAKETELRRRATTYYWDGSRQFEDRFLYPIHGYAAGGIFSSARDLAALFAAIDDGQFLKPESFKLLTTPAPLKDGRPGEFAIGWTASVYRGEPVYGHSGGPALADIMYVPRRDMTIVALGNQRRFFPLLAQSIADTRLPAPLPRRAIRDRNPALTRTVRSVLTQAGGGAPEAASFNAEGAGARDFLSHFGGALLTAVGPIQSIEALSEAILGTDVRRSYRIRFESRDMVWVARTDRGGLIAELRPGGDNE
ncbi:MAG: serine hydrolase [Candidatus Sphingomonas phytovorans]|nr:serine hydrolase domain-containing protein [Sphingomonas sp.]WEK00814.1 MAG: serine hydrolase [Sphingomonas sp.]